MEILQHEYSQPPKLPSPHFWWVVNLNYTFEVFCHAKGGCIILEK